jgi:hypothetical protein
MDTHLFIEDCNIEAENKSFFSPRLLGITEEC